MNAEFIREIEEFAMNAWPSLQTRLYDGWVLRFADGYTKRANSVNPLYSSTLSLSEKIKFCESEYRSRNIPVVFKLTPASMPGDIDRVLESRGYSREDETVLRLLDIRGRRFDAAKGTEAAYELTGRWFEGFCRCSTSINEITKPTALKILQNLSGKIVYVSKVVDGEIAGCGYGAVEQGYVGIFDIAVHRSQRGKGYAFEIMNRILREAQQMGASDSYLQVVAGNIPAEKLYDKVGYKESYRYWYRKLI
ncbi:MAG TPA: GNAT family N-acetyltransferase [Clostridia bacterium]|nr:GNAT family N-acetyltransferase [Clostridia bacterium]